MTALKKGICGILLLMAAIGSYAQCNQKCRSRVVSVNLQSRYPTCPQFDQYVTVIRDDFNRGELDTNFWEGSLGYVHHAPNADKTQEYNTSDNLQFLASNNGTLRMRSTYDPIYAIGDTGQAANFLFDDDIPNLRWWNFKSGAITSKWLFDKGRYVARCKIPSGWNMWPAFWLFGDCADEIDIFEFQQENDPLFTENHNNHVHDRRVSWSVHAKLTGCDPSVDQNIDTKSDNWSQDMTTAMHTYSVDWDDFQIVFAVDAQVHRRFFHYYRRKHVGPIFTYEGVASCDDIVSGATYVEDPQFTDAMVSIRLNSAIRNNADQAEFPKNFDVDWFVMLDKINCQQTKFLNTNLDIAASPSRTAYGDRTITAGTIVVNPISPMEISGPVQNFEKGGLIILTASNEIQILPGTSGFDVTWDGNLIGQIKPCLQNKQSDTLEAFFSLPEPEITYVLNDSTISEELALQMIQHPDSIDDFRLVPNPASGVTYLCGTKLGDAIQVTDGLGRRKLNFVSEGRFNEPIPIEAFSPGVYFVQVMRVTHIVRNLKLVIQK
jgi:hypothetical protein